MPIVVTCSNCRRSFRVADALAGRRAKCGSCQTPIVIPRPPAISAEARVSDGSIPLAVAAVPPAGAPAVASVARPKSRLGQAANKAVEPPAEALAAQIAASFRGEYQRPPTSLGYRLVLVIGTIGLALVPLGYAASVAALAWLVCWQAQHLSGGFGLRIRLPLLIASIVALLFMLRALVLLFYRRKHVPESPRFPLETYPALASLVREISQRVGSPLPTKLEFMCEPNAAASYGDTLWQQLFRRELTLHLGLTLVGGRTIGQLSEVIAHELGHFSQRGATRLTALHRWLLAWNAAAAMQPSSLDFEKAADAEWSFTRWFYVAAALGVATSRGVLLICYNAANLLCAVILRQLEYDADRASVAIVGLRTFTENEYWLEEINRGFREAISAAGECLPRNCLPDDLPDLALAWLKQWPDEQRAVMRKRLKNDKTDLLSTHPSPRDRIEMARRTGAQGVFECDLPARWLLPNYAGLCRAVSRGFYFNMMGSAPKDLVFAPPAELFPYWEVYASRAAAPQRTTQAPPRP
ncbi:MAG: M48 family metalloprotease [Pirellulales bacterium]